MINKYYKDEKRIEKLLENDTSDLQKIEDEMLIIVEKFSNKDLVSFEQITNEIINSGLESINMKLEEVDELKEPIWSFFLNYFENHDDEWTAIYNGENLILYTDLYTVVDSSTDFLNQVLSIDDENTDSELLFRGQENMEWELIPSIFRDDNILSENEFYNKIRLREPLEFNDGRILDNIVKMQHYGLPTRLLDITYNPLVALYFACNKQEKTNAIVYVFNEYMRSSYESEAVNILAHSVLVSRGWKTRDDYINKLKETNRSFAEKKNDFIQGIIEENSFINASNHNERIKRQQGAFIIFGMDFSKSGMPFKSIDDKVKKRFVIPSECKEKIMKELELLGINEGFIFPELEYQTSYIKTKYRVLESYSPYVVEEKSADDQVEERAPREKQEEYTSELKRKIIDLCDKASIEKNSILEDENLIEYMGIVDWYSKDSALVKIRVTIKKLLKKLISDKELLGDTIIILEKYFEDIERKEA